MIEVTAHAEGAVLPVRAKPGGKVNAVVDEYNGAVRVSVTAPADQGKANEAIIRVLADALAWRRSDIRLVSGPTSRDKRFLIVGMTPVDLAARLDAAMTPTVFDPIDPET
jgi:uncharacterized protein (TIGR00251 family)